MKFFKQSLSAWALAAALFAGASSAANAQTVIWGAGSGNPTTDSIGRFATTVGDTAIANTPWTAVATAPIANLAFGMWEISFTGDSRGTNSLTVTTRLPLTSPSLADGAAMFDSDLHYTNSNSTLFPQAGHITSPIIDLTGYTDSTLSISMHTAYLDFATTASVIGFSKDNGATWREVDVRTLAGPAGTRAAFNGVVAMYIGNDLAGATDLDSCRIRLRFDGDSYFWAADDINIRTATPPPPFDLTISGTTAGNTLGDAFTVGYVSNNFFQPISQVSSEDYFFGARVLNNGVSDILPANNAKLMVMVDFETAPNVWANQVMDSLAIDSVQAGARVTFTENFTSNWLPTQVGRYRTTYYVKHDLADASTVGDTSRHFFNITDSTGYYSKVPLAVDGGVSAPQAGFPVAGGTNRVSGFEWGNMYYFPTGSSYKIDSINFRAYIQNAAAGYTGGQVAVRISKFIDFNGDGVLDDASPNPELILVGLGTVDFTSVTTGFKRASATIINVNDGEPLVLQDTSIYLVSLSQDVATGLETATGTFTGYWYGSNTTVNYGVNAAALAAIPSPIRVAEMTAAGAPAVNDWNWIGFGPDNVPAIGINFSANTIATNRLVANANHNLSVFPNPTNDVLNVKIDLATQSNVQYLITDVTGRVVRNNVSRNVQNEVVAFNVADLAAGVYMVTVRTSEGISTERFVKQ
jgi:hypothetical protein